MVLNAFKDDFSKYKIPIKELNECDRNILAKLS
jgi:hypothetical protein